MFGFLNPKAATQRKAQAGAEAMVRHTKSVWDLADLERRVSLLKRSLQIQDDKLLLAYVHAPWSQIPNGVQVKLALAVTAQEETTALAIKMDRVSALGHKAGEIAAQGFSTEQFSQFFGQKTLAANWNSEKALGIWYALGRFCFLISIGSLGSVQDADMNSLIVSGQEALMATWGMPEPTLRPFEGFNGTKLADAYSVYKAINNGEMFGRFFALFVSEILGNNVSFSSNDFSDGTLGQLLRGEGMEIDPFLANEVSSMFFKTKKTIHEFVYPLLSEIYHNFASALRPR